MNSTDQPNGPESEHGSQQGRHVSIVKSRQQLIGHKAEQAQKVHDELEKLRKQFTVDTQRLKKITKRFQEELEEGKPRTCSSMISFVVGAITEEAVKHHLLVGSVPMFAD